MATDGDGNPHHVALASRSPLLPSGLRIVPHIGLSGSHLCAPRGVEPGLRPSALPLPYFSLANAARSIASVMTLWREPRNAASS